MEGEISGLEMHSQTPKGTSAMNVRFRPHGQRRSGLSVAAVLFLVICLSVPSLAIARLARSFDLRFIFGYILAISVLTLWFYWDDKRRAESGDWRTPESTLHFTELLGGWPAAFIAQHTLRHKISKTSYQLTFWTIVAFHEAVSCDFLSDWHYSEEALKLIQH